MKEFENEEEVGRLIPRDFPEGKEVIVWGGDCFQWIWFNAQCNSGAQFCTVFFDTEDVLKASVDSDGNPVDADTFFQEIQEMHLIECSDWWDDDYMEMADHFNMFPNIDLNEATMKTLVDASKAHEHNKKFLY